MRLTCAFLYKVRIIKLSTGGAVIAVYRTMQLIDDFASRRLMQPVNILGDYRVEPSRPFHLSQFFVRGIRLCIKAEHLRPVEFEKFRSVVHKKSVADHRFRRILPTLPVKTVGQDGVC